MVICLQRGADCLHMVQMMLMVPKTPSSLASFKSRLVLPVWHRLTKAVLEMLMGVVVAVDCQNKNKLSLLTQQHSTLPTTP